MRQNLPVPAGYAAVVRIGVIIRQTRVCFKTLINTNVSYCLADASNPAQPRHILQKFGLSIARVSSAGDFRLAESWAGNTGDSINTPATRLLKGRHGVEEIEATTLLLFLILLMRCLLKCG